MALTEDQLREAWEVLKPNLDRLIKIEVYRAIPILLKEALVTERRDIGDELVRILLEKAFTEKPRRKQK